MAALDGLSGFDRSLSRRLESSAAIFHELKAAQLPLRPAVLLQHPDDARVCGSPGQQRTSTTSPTVDGGRRGGATIGRLPEAESPRSHQNDGTRADESRDDIVDKASTSPNFRSVDDTRTTEEMFTTTKQPICSNGDIAQAAPISFSISRILGNDTHGSFSSTRTIDHRRQLSAGWNVGGGGLLRFPPQPQFRSFVRHTPTVGGSESGGDSDGEGAATPNSRSSDDSAPQQRRQRLQNASTRDPDDGSDIEDDDNGDCGEDEDDFDMKSDDDQDEKSCCSLNETKRSISPTAAAAAAAAVVLREDFDRDDKLRQLHPEDCSEALEHLTWLQCTRYKPPKLPRSKKLRDGIKKRKLGRNPRVPFTQHQVAILEQKFRHTHYLSSVDVAELSSALNLTENRVKIWFQNRRARERRSKETTPAPSINASSLTSSSAPVDGSTISAGLSPPDVTSSLQRLPLTTNSANCPSASPFYSDAQRRRLQQAFIIVDKAAAAAAAQSQPFQQHGRGVAGFPSTPADPSQFDVGPRGTPAEAAATVSAAALQAALDSRVSWSQRFPAVAALRMPPVMNAAAADLLVQLSSNFAAAAAAAGGGGQHRFSAFSPIAFLR